jgi:hypothetical protein
MVRKAVNITVVSAILFLLADRSMILRTVTAYPVCAGIAVDDQRIDFWNLEFLVAQYLDW